MWYVNGEIKKLQFEENFNGGKAKILVTKYFLETEEGKKYLLDRYDCKPEYLAKTFNALISPLGFGRNLEPFSGYIQKHSLTCYQV